jgi:CBS domain-containing protein
VKSHPQSGLLSAESQERNSQVPAADNGGLTVRDAMRRRPKTLSRDATVGDLRRLFANPKVLDVVLVDGEAFAGLVDRDALAGLPDETPAQALARSAGVTIAPEANLQEAVARLEGDGSWRLVVVGADGVTLEGLLCLNATRTGFCR